MLSQKSLALFFRRLELIVIVLIENCFDLSIFIIRPAGMHCVSRQKQKADKSDRKSDSAGRPGLHTCSVGYSKKKTI
jgi:hypothetical protein